MRIRPFEPQDAAAVADLFADYMQEVYGEPNAMSPDVLLRDMGTHFSMLVAVDGADQPIGFLAWRPTYDLHNAVAGGEIADLFVARAHRGRALSVRLVAFVARAVLAQGGTYICTGVLVDDARRLRLVRRMTVGFAAETVYLSGRGLRELAQLADADLKTLAANLPSPAASREP